MKTVKCYLDFRVEEKGSTGHPDPRYYFDLVEEANNHYALNTSALYDEPLLHHTELIFYDAKQWAKMNEEISEQHYCIVSLNGKPKHHFHVEKFVALGIVFHRHEVDWMYAYSTISFKIGALETTDPEQINDYLLKHRMAINALVKLHDF